MEAVRRTAGVTLYDTQLLAGLALSRGAIAEMATGEGKTLAAALPALLNALAGHGVHVATTNAYLARRDAGLLRPAFELLGVSLGLLPEGPASEEKRRAYACDVTYGTGYEFGFDYLRDQVAALQPCAEARRALSPIAARREAGRPGRQTTARARRRRHRRGG